ncbi:MAG: hypothetical protein HFI40_06710 [Lachnospiraceae bacterium]|jgi:hypothetical protein|nr:hypothetical protein [Lachnospiraceae bacterium]
MYTNGVSSTGSAYTNAASYTNTKTNKTADSSTTSSANKNTEQGAVYEPSKPATNTSSSKKPTKAENAAIVSQMKADLEQRKQQMQNIVNKMLSQQANTWKKTNGVDMYAFLRSGNLTADAKTIAQAKADIAEDGYWGVEQTSDRLLSFAKALAGNDAGKADEMLAAFKKGFERATGAWGSKLPDICQKTYDATVEKFNAWKNGTEGSEA